MSDLNFYHGSIKELEINSYLLAQSDGYVQSESDEDLEGFEDFMESLRPEDKISRFNAVFMADNTEDIDNLGGYTDYIYEVEPIGAYSKHDLAWYSKASSYYLIDNEKAKECALKYWSGERYDKMDESVFEYIVESAEIIKEVYE
tara:strand:+ start:63207 stop:63641 length:435 start_codon:yes stop_codon:yes gene_type:complete